MNNIDKKSSAFTFHKYVEGKLVSPIGSHGGELVLPSSTPTTTTLRHFHATEGTSGGWLEGRCLSGRPPWRKEWERRGDGKHPSSPPLFGRDCNGRPPSRPCHYLAVVRLLWSTRLRACCLTHQSAHPKLATASSR
ncbi:hypothetical protein Sjap_024181 [Stephania japonica]|uniref:Uncharacterized protein n=1 Tax=Stephania japonica TaxID=461633 RepID=A0AAP0HL91_9MAGN